MDSLFSKCFDRSAGTHQIAVPMGFIDPADRRPELILADPAHRECGLLPAVGMRPFLSRDHGQSMWCIVQWIVLLVPFAQGEFIDLLLDRDHGARKAVKFLFGFAFCGFDHNGPWNGETHSRRMVSVIHQALGNVRNLHADLLERTAVQDHFMSHSPFVSTVQHIKMIAQAGLQIARIEQGDLRRALQTSGSKHADIGVADDQDETAAPRGSGNL